MSFQKEIPSIPVDRKVFNWLWVERNCITVPGNDDDGSRVKQWSVAISSSLVRDIAHVERSIEERLSLISGASIEPLQS